MTTHSRFAIALIAVFALLPFPAAALSVRQYESKTQEQRVDFLSSAIAKIVADVATVNPALSKSIYDYFHVIPQGHPESPGLIAFAGELLAVENMADKGKVDLDKVQIEGILLDIVKTDVVAKQKSKTDTPGASANK